MFNTLFEKVHKFHHGQSMQLRLIVPLCIDTVMLFYNDCTFFHYSLSQQKTIYRSKLPGTPYKAIAISQDKIVVSIIQTRSILLLDIPQHQMFLVLSKIPSWQIKEQIKCRQVFFQTWIESFQENGGFIIGQKKQDQKKVKFSYAKSQNIVDSPSFMTRQFSIKDLYYEKIDEISTIAIFKQTPEQNKFKFTTYDLLDNFKEIQYLVEHKSFNSLSIIRSIRRFKQDSFIIFINSAKPQILIYNKSEVRQIIVGLPRIFLYPLFINSNQQYGIFVFLSLKNTDKDHNIQIINLNNGNIIDTLDTTIKQLAKAWSDNYFVDYEREKKNNTCTTFTTRHLINKQGHYAVLLENLFSDHIQSFKETVLSLLQ